MGLGGAVVAAATPTVTYLLAIDQDTIGLNKFLVLPASCLCSPKPLSLQFLRLPFLAAEIGSSSPRRPWGMSCRQLMLIAEAVDLCFRPGLLCPQCSPKNKGCSTCALSFLSVLIALWLILLRSQSKLHSIFFQDHDSVKELEQEGVATPACWNPMQRGHLSFSSREACGYPQPSGLVTLLETA